MRRYKYILVSIATTMFLAVAAPVSAQMMYGNSSTGNSASSDADVQKGQDVYDQLQNNRTTRNKLTADNFDVLGDFYMARMMGTSAHSTMDQQMTRYMGDTANTQMHVALAKRLSGCDPNANYPAIAANYAPVAGMTGMMNGNWNMMGYNNNSWSGTNTLLTVLLILAIAVAVFAWFRPRTITKGKKQS